MRANLSRRYKIKVFKHRNHPLKHDCAKTTVYGRTTESFLLLNLIKNLWEWKIVQKSDKFVMESLFKVKNEGIKIDFYVKRALGKFFAKKKIKFLKGKNWN